MKFTDFIGNERIKEQLSYLEASRHLPHAIVLEGEEGIGKRTLARELALNLLCKGDGEPPCRQCAQCSKVLKGVHPDVDEYTAPNRARAFHIEKVREVISDAYMQPNEADYRIFILGNCQSMTIEAQNALLKILEEPPSYVLFILTVTNKSALLNTVLSRSVVISLEGVEAGKAAEYICRRDDSLSYDDAYKACEVWGGNIGKAIESLSDGKLSQINHIANDMARAMIAENEYELLKVCAVFKWDRDVLYQSLTLLKSIVRDALLFECGDSLSGSRETAELLYSRLSREKLVRVIETIDALRSLALKNMNVTLLQTKVCADLRTAQGR